jgi:hypothetical protein
VSWFAGVAGSVPVAFWGQGVSGRGLRDSSLVVGVIRFALRRGILNISSKRGRFVVYGEYTVDTDFAIVLKKPNFLGS